MMDPTFCRKINAMQFQTIPAPEGLQHLIKTCWFVQDAAETGLKTFRTIADGTPGLIFQRSESGETLWREGKKLAPVFVFGQSTRFAEISTAGRLDLLGIYFQPHALRCIFGLDSNEITDSCFDLTEMTSRHESSLVGQLFEAACPQLQLQRIGKFLHGLLGKNAPKEDFAARLALLKIHEKQGNISLSELQRSLRLSERSLQRRFRQSVGLPPKLYLRIRRFQTSLAQIQRQDFNRLTDIAYDNGYADQSHFLRDFKEFTGWPPSHFLRQTEEVVEGLHRVEV